MSPLDDIRSELRAAREALDRAEAKLESADPMAPPAIWESMAEYAKRRKVSLMTVKRWRKSGMPVSEMGRAIRVEIEVADEWVARNGKAKAGR